MTHHALSLPDILGADSGADASYRHISKRVTPGEPLEVPGAVLKWYWINAEDRPIPEDVTRLARGYLSTNRLQARGPGFVLLHRCGADFYFLLVSTWRNSNELWETVYYKDSDAMPDFALFPRDGDHKPNWCVWELVPVWHEQQAWVRFLKSGRDENAVQFWLRDRFTGAA
jgi:hypothetical protein